LKIFGRHLIYFPPSWYIAPRKIWQTWSRTKKAFWNNCYIFFCPSPP
jgi:hypothetical protein